MPAELTDKFKRSLRGQAHRLKPVVQIGKEGLTDSVVAAVDSALLTHELIKVKLNQNSLEDKNDVAAGLSERLEALLVQRIGKTIILYRERTPEE